MSKEYKVSTFKNPEEVEEVRKKYIEGWRAPELTWERAELVTQAYEESEGQPIILRRAYTIKKLLSEMPLFIAPEDLIVGYPGPKPLSSNVYPEGAWRFVVEQVDTFETREGDRFTVSEETKRKLKEICRKWEGKTIQDYVSAVAPRETKKANDAWIFTYENYVTGGIGHVILNYEKVLNFGIDGLENFIKTRRNQLDLTKAEDLERGIFYKACLIVCDGVKTFARRYGQLAREMAEEERNPNRKEELLQIAEVNERVPVKPARTFWEACQCVWTLHVINWLENNGHSHGFGRLDRYLYPYYKRDIDEGKMTREDAKSLLISFWFKVNSCLKLYSNSAIPFYAGFPATQVVTIGGLTPDGTGDGTNDVSEIILEVEQAVRLSQPALALFWSAHMKDSVFLKACRVIRETNKPKVFNQHVVMQALTESGVSPEDALKYGAIVGCVEATLQNKTWGWTNSGYFSLSKCLELTLHNGTDPITNEKIGLATGDPTQFKSFDDFVNAVKKQISYCMKLWVIGIHVVQMAHTQLWPEVYQSMLLDGCLERGMDAEQGGADVNFAGGNIIGTATIADSLMAIKEMVFEKKKMSMQELIEALDKNFEGREEARQELLSLPKFGNDIDEVDFLAAEIVNYCIDVFTKYRNARGGPFVLSTQSVSAQTGFGAKCGATPNGRKAGLPISDANSPSHGAEKEGPTAVFNSVLKLPHTRLTNGSLLNMKFPKSLLKDEEKLKVFASLVKSYLKRGGYHVQFNIVDPEVLRDALEHPENYPDLMVRVAAYVALWSQLSPMQRREIYSRATLGV